MIPYGVPFVDTVWSILRVFLEDVCISSVEKL